MRQDTTTSPLGVIIGTFSHTIPLSTSITTPEEQNRGKDHEIRTSEIEDYADSVSMDIDGIMPTKQELWGRK